MTFEDLAALRSTSSLPCFAQAFRDGSSEAIPGDDVRVKQVEDEIEELRDLGMWGRHA